MVPEASILGYKRDPETRNTWIQKGSRQKCKRYVITFLIFWKITFFDVVFIVVIILFEIIINV